MWTCPKCKYKFYNTNQSHSCGNYTINDFLKGKSETMIGLFNYFISEYRKIGDFDIHPVKTRVALLTKMRFCSINKIGADYINIHLVFTQPFIDNLCFNKIDNLDNRFFVHHFKIHNKSDINKEVKKYMTLAYEIGNRKHVQAKFIKDGKKIKSNMEQKIQLKHPAGKKAISMDKDKYVVIEKSLLNCLKGKAESTHAEILKTITEDFKKNEIKFVGSIEWHMEWVKLDLEAKKKITRIADTTPIKFKLT